MRRCNQTSCVFLLYFGVWLIGRNERFAPAGTDELFDELAEMRFLELVEPPGAIFGGIAPRVWIGADESARRLAVAEIDEIHGDDLVDDARQFTSDLLPLQLD